MKYANITKLSCMLLIATGIFSCIRRDFDKVTLDPWEPSLAVPLIHSTLKIKDIATKVDIDNLNVIENTDGMYTLIYRDTLYSDPAERIILLPDQAYSRSYGLTLSENIAVNSGEPVTKEHSENESFDTENSEELTSIIFKEGRLNWSLASEFPHDMLIRFQIPKLTRNGIPYSGEVVIDESSNRSASLSEDLTGYTMDLTGNNGTQINTFDWEVEITVTSTGNFSIGNEALQITAALTNLKYAQLYGKFGTIVLPSYSGIVGIDIFDNEGQGQVIFNDPKIRMNVENTFGVPMGFAVNELLTQNNSGQTVPVNSSGALLIPGPNLINYPASPGQRAETRYVLNNTNSNIVDAFAPAPNQLRYNIRPSILSDNRTNFVEDKSQFTAYLEAEFPMDGIVKIYSLQDTIYDISLPDEDYIQSVLLKIKTENSMPVDLHLQGYWLDVNGDILDSLIIPNKNIVNSGIVNQNGEVIQASTEYVEVRYDRDRYNQIKNADRLLLDGNIITTDQGSRPVKFFSHNELKLQISILVNAKVEFE